MLFLAFLTQGGARSSLALGYNHVTPTEFQLARYARIKTNGEHHWRGPGMPEWNRGAIPRPLQAAGSSLACP